MRTRTGQVALVAVLILAMLPEAARCQNMPPPEVNLPFPFGGERYRQQGTGLFFAAEMLYMKQTNHLIGQSLAVRGFVDVDGSVTGTPGTSVGSGVEALNTSQLRERGKFQPGLALAAGWRFMDGTLLEVGWWHLTDARYSAFAGPIPRNFEVGPALADTFLFAPVFNFPTDYAGPLQNLAIGNPGATFGIWNAATEMQITLVQRFDQGHMNLRIPIDQGEAHRMFGILGGRAVIMWERFTWRTVGRDQFGQAFPIDVANYFNIVSNRIYGANIGCGYDWYCGSSPVGAFAISAELHGTLGMNFVKERARYELGDRSTAATRTVNEVTLAPVVQGDVSLWWYPYEGIQCRLGWSGMGIFNTIAARRPVDFNVSSIDPHWSTAHRFLHGFHVGIGFIF